MTVIAKTADWISPEEYLEGEKWAQTRHEYVGGHVFAMAGASDNHNRTALSIATGSVILEQDQMQAAVMRPATEGWKTEIIRGPGAVLKLSDLKIEIPLARIYERTEVARPTG